MWQFMPATGKHFELKQNVFRDDRRDVLASTRAALDYLQKLHGMFGDWHLALAAYNWGEGSVGRAIGKNKRLGLATDYPSLTMPMETRFYVPKLQAIKNIVANPSSFNSTLPQIGNHPYFQSVSIRRDIDTVLAAKLAEVPLSDFKALNPSLNKPVILAAGTPQILLPWDSAEVFEQNLDRFTGSRLASWTVWLAPRTLRVTEAAKQVGMNEAQLRELNSIPKGMLIKPGSALLVPRAADAHLDVTETIADRGQVSFAPEIVQVRKTMRARKGDSVESIARRYTTSAANVAQWNKVASNATFKAGQSVVVYVSASAADSRAKKSPQSASRSSEKPKARPAAKKAEAVTAKRAKA
jgi:membrane-bound lytic murein transglycosylase D